MDDHLANVPISELIKQIKWPTGKDLIGLIPIVHWLPRYQFKANFATDVIGGLTMGAVMVPQGTRKCYRVVVLWWFDSMLSRNCLRGTCGFAGVVWPIHLFHCGYSLCDPRPVPARVHGYECCMNWCLGVVTSFFSPFWCRHVLSDFDSYEFGPGIHA